MNKQDPPKWHAIYKDTSEKRFFVGTDGKSGLLRSRDKNGKLQVWRSVKGLASDSGLSSKQVEEIINDYIQLGVVLNKPDNPELWGYWENVGTPDVAKPMAKVDQEERVNKVTGKVSNAGAGNGPLATSKGNGATKAAPSNPSVP